MCIYSHTTLKTSFFFFNDTATTEIYTLSLHDALPICWQQAQTRVASGTRAAAPPQPESAQARRSEEHTSELQSQSNLVCRLLLEKKKKKIIPHKRTCTNSVLSPYYDAFRDQLSTIRSA